MIFWVQLEPCHHTWISFPRGSDLKISIFNLMGKAKESVKTWMASRLACTICCRIDTVPIATRTSNYSCRRLLRSKRKHWRKLRTRACFRFITSLGRCRQNLGIKGSARPTRSSKAVQTLDKSSTYRGRSQVRPTRLLISRKLQMTAS